VVPYGSSGEDVTRAFRGDDSPPGPPEGAAPERPEAKPEEDLTNLFK